MAPKPTFFGHPAHVLIIISYSYSSSYIPFMYLVLITKLFSFSFDSVMGGARFRREQDREKERLKPVTPEDISSVFDEQDIERTWQFLENVFHLNKEKWRTHFENAYAASPKELSKMESFARFG